MIPDPSNPCWRQLVTGKRTIQTEMLGLQLILKRMQKHLAADGTDAAIGAAAAEVHAFFVKYQSGLGREIDAL